MLEINEFECYEAKIEESEKVAARYVTDAFSSYQLRSTHRGL